MSTTAPVRLTCPDCRRENEPERLYCHDCGARLDHSQLGPRQTESTESAAEAHKRITGMFDRRRGQTRAFLIKCVKLIAGAGLAAAIVLMLLPPPALPPAVKSETLPPQISLDLEGLTQFHRPPHLRYSEAEVNAYLAYVMRKKKDMLDHVVLDFERTVIAFRPGQTQAAIGRSIFGYTIYTAAVFNIQVQGGKLNATPISGAIGRLPIHPTLMAYSGFLFSDVVRALEREQKVVARVGSIDVRDKEIAFQ